ncbi:MAG: SDR family oxidoreductase [Opitutaceae bacterium]
MPKTILIAGGTSGIGLASAHLLKESGHRVICACRHPDAPTDEPDLETLPFDATDPHPTLELPDSLDGCVYYPGTINLKPFHRLTDEDYLNDLQINLLGAVRLLRLALPGLKKADRSSVVLFSSVAVQTGLSFHASIASAKGAIEGLTRSLAAEWAPRIRVNAIAPSLTDTPLAQPFLNSEIKRTASEKRHPLNRVGSAQDTAKAVAYLLSDDSGFMTGQVLKLDGGLSALRTL